MSLDDPLLKKLNEVSKEMDIFTNRQSVIWEEKKAHHNQIYFHERQIADITYEMHVNNEEIHRLVHEKLILAKSDLKICSLCKAKKEGKMQGRFES